MKKITKKNLLSWKNCCGDSIKTYLSKVTIVNGKYVEFSDCDLIEDKDFISGLDGFQTAKVRLKAILNQNLTATVLISGDLVFSI